MNTRSNLPEYVERGGEQVLRHPFLHERALLRAFVVHGAESPLARLCDRFITAPSGGAVRARPLGERVVLTFTTIPRLSSTDPRDRTFGACAETDVAFWLPISIETAHHAPRVAWLIPYIFVDNPYAVATGRELYGFPKAQATFTFPPSPTSAGDYTVDAFALQRHAPSTMAASQRLFEVLDHGAPRGLGGAIKTRADALGALYQLFTGDGAAPRALLQNGVGEVPLVFLRQLRDLHDPRRAAFQEIVIAPARALTVHDAGTIARDFELRIHHADSHPIAKDLGLHPTSSRVEAAFHCDFDFIMDRGERLWSAATVPRAMAPVPAPRKQKIAVLGGGISALSAVCQITSQPDWQSRYDITVYQMGFRIGGKGASGRNPDIADRIEEHGLHIWFGFYENAFRLMRDIYAEAARPAGGPLASWQDAFKPHSLVVLQEPVGDEWRAWPFEFPGNDALPGDAAAVTGPRDWVKSLASWVRTLAELAVKEGLAGDAQSKSAAAILLVQLAFASATAVAHISDRAARSDGTETSRSLAALREVKSRLWTQIEREIEPHDDTRRIWISLDFAITLLIGVYRDDVLDRGFEALDDEDWIEWLGRHGASPLTLRSAPVRAVYDLAFAYEDGDVSRPSFAAGTTLHGVLRMLFAYKGAFMWKMQAGMGDTVFTPLYEVLKRRGVHFEFFSKVEHLELSPDGRTIDSIRVARQATPKNGTYDPLVTVKGLACWPDRPNYDQLVEGEELRSCGIDLESSWSPWEPVARRALRRGEDFDSVILGIPVGALRSICRDLVERKPAFRDMVDNVKTVCTLAFQLWTTPDRHALGWKDPGLTSEGPIQGAFVEPIDTWADMTHLADKEHWPASHQPGHIAYFCGPLTDPTAYPETSDHAFPERERDRVKGMIESFMDNDLRHLWPKAISPKAASIIRSSSTSRIAKAAPASKASSGKPTSNRRIVTCSPSKAPPSSGSAPTSPASTTSSSPAIGCARASAAGASKPA
ncbi:cytoplasmic membrane protein [Minicystis rosea]|nr:cytoplasmic membrane protein [Minicystis rosea]